MKQRTFHITGVHITRYTHFEGQPADFFPNRRHTYYMIRQLQIFIFPKEAKNSIWQILIITQSLKRFIWWMFTWTKIIQTVKQYPRLKRSELLTRKRCMGILYSAKWSNLWRGWWYTISSSALQKLQDHGVSRKHQWSLKAWGRQMNGRNTGFSPMKIFCF